MGLRAVGVSRPSSGTRSRNRLTNPTGTLTKNIQCHVELSQMYPPRIGPRMGASTMVMDHSDSAMPRFSCG